MAWFRRYGRVSAWRRKAALLAVLAVLQQALVFALATPAQAFPSAADARLGLASICGAHAGGNGSAPSHAPAPDCQICPLCQALVVAGLAITPQPAAALCRTGFILYRLAPPALAVRITPILQAAQPRGPPRASDHT
jgi:hypothetical protein